MHPDVKEIILSEDVLRKRVHELGEEISRDYAGETVLLVAVLRGAALFIADLAREVTVPVEMDFMAVSSYGSSTKSSGVVRILKDLDELIEDRNVLVVEDILDTGLTLKYLLRVFEEKKPKHLRVVVLLDKVERRIANVKADYAGFVIPNEFVVGYGLDYDERYRNLADVCVLRLGPHGKTKPE